MGTYIDSFHKESERRAAYPEHSNASLSNVAKTIVDSDSITPQNKKDGVE